MPNVGSNRGSALIADLESRGLVHDTTDRAALAERLGHGRLLATGGGGYHRPNIAAGWNAVVEGLFG